MRRLLRCAISDSYFFFFAAFLAPPFFAAFLAPPFFAAFLAPVFLAAFFAPFLAAFFAAMVFSSEGVNRPIEPPVVRTSQWVGRRSVIPTAARSHGETATSCGTGYMVPLMLVNRAPAGRLNRKFFTAVAISGRSA